MKLPQKFDICFFTVDKIILEKGLLGQSSFEDEKCGRQNG